MKHIRHTQRSTNGTETGRAGETAAARFLLELGMEIVAQNVRFRLGEIDLVVRDGDTLVFVEVKTRTGTGFGSPAEAVTARKQRQLVRLAELYLSQHNAMDAACRFDVIAVRPGPSGGWACSHIRDAFGAT